MNAIRMMLKAEEEGLTQDEAVELGQYLLDTGLHGTLPHGYGMLVQQLIDEGLLPTGEKEY